MALISIHLNAQTEIQIDTTALKQEVVDLYNKIDRRGTLDQYKSFFDKSETLHKHIGNKKTLALWISRMYYRAAKKFNVETPNTSIGKQLADPYLQPTIRKEYLLKAKEYLIEHYGFYDDESFSALNYALKAVEQEIQSK